MASEISFPRGGRQTFSKSNKAETNEDLFRAPVEKSVKKKSKSKSRKRKGDEIEDDEDVVVIDTLNSQNVAQGLVVLGCITKVFNYSIEFSLPGGIFGTVPVTNTSTSYVELLKNYSEDPENFEDNLVTMPNLFKVGDCYPVKIMNYSVTESGAKAQIQLSINPKDINDDLVPSSIYHGMVLLGAVSSVEGHGYVIDMGIIGVSGFLSTKNASHHIQKVNEGRLLAVGEILHLAVDMPELNENPLEGRTITLTTKKKGFEVDVSEKVTLQTILPGMTLPIIITEANHNGLVIRCLAYNGCIHKNNLTNSFDDPRKYPLGQEMKALVLFKHPVSQVIHMSLLPKPSSKNIKSRFENIKIGDKIQDAKIIEVHPHSVYLKLSETVKGFVKNPHISDQEVSDATEILSVGETVPCRVISFSYMDKIVKVSLKKSVLKQAFIENESIKAGDIVKGVVQKVDSKGIHVKLGLYVRGFIDPTHMSDIPITHPEKLFHVGGEITCRVLKLDRKEGGTSHFLTAKKTLVNSKLPPLTTLDSVTPGMIADGFVVRINSNGLLVSFYNDIWGWVPVAEISNSFVDYPEKLFYLGQVVKCRILDVSIITRKMRLSLKLTTRKTMGKKDLAESTKLKVGDIVSLEITGKTDKGLDVLVPEDKLRAFIPTMHLSDHPHLCKLILERFQIGNTIEKACIFSLKGVIICTMKAMFLKAAAKNKIVFQYSQVQEGTILPSVIKGFMTYGILVEMGNNVTGLVHKSKIANSTVKNPGLSGLVTHQSLIVKVLRLQDHKGSVRIELSSRLLDVLPKTKPWKPALDNLESYMADWSRIADLSPSNIGSLKTGQIVEVEVTKVTKEGCLCQLVDSEIQGIVVLNNIGALIPTQGDKIRAMVLHVDFNNNCVELSLCHRLIKLSLKANKSTILNQIKKGSIQKCQILLVREHFALASLLDPAYGILAYLPVKRHPNDTIGNLYSIGQKTRMLIRRKKERYVMGILESHELQASKEYEMLRSKETPLKKDLKRKLSDKTISESPSKRKALDITNAQISTKKKLIKDTSKLSNEETQAIVSDKVITVIEEITNGKRDSLVEGLEVGDEVKGTISGRILGKVYVELDSHKTGFFRIEDTIVSNQDITKTGEVVNLRIKNITQDEIEFEVPTLDENKSNVGTILDGVISHFNKKKLFVKFRDNKFGFLLQNELPEKCKNLAIGNKLSVKIEDINNGDIRVSLVEVLDQPTQEAKESKNKETVKTEFIVGDVVEGTVLYWKKGTIFVQLAPKRVGIITKSTIQAGVDNLKTGSKVKVQVITVKKKGYDLKLVKKLDEPVKPAISTIDVPILNEEDISEEKDNIPRLQINESFAWNIDATPNLSTLAQLNQNQESSSSDEDEDDTDIGPRKKRKKGERQKEEEDKLRKQEERIMDLDRIPETIDDFERLILSSPDNSMVWLKYMAFYLQQTEIDKARVVAQRALKTISFREENEKLNIWFSLLNLESMYGTQESLQDVFSKALEVNEPLKIYRQMIKIYMESEKIQEAEELHQTIIKKYRQDPTVWTDFGLFYMKIEKPEQARKLMERSFNSLDKRHHIDIISKFAQMEFSNGDPERGKTLFKNVLNNYPKRTDIWSVFIDVLIKHGEIDEARLNLEKLSSSTLPLKKMKFVFKKFLDFEKEHGTEENVDKVKLKALEYVQTSNYAT